MRSSRRKLLSRLMCFVMGLICGTNAGAHQKKKSSSNESLNLPEWIIVGSTSMMLYEIILKPLGSRLLSRSGNNKNNIKYIKKEYDDNNAKYVKFNDSENDEPKNIKYVIKINDENYGEWERRNYIQNVLDSIDKTVDEASEYEWLRTIPESLGKIRVALHCLFLNYSNTNDGDIKNAKLTIGEKIDWSFTYGKENYVSLDYVREILEWYRENSYNFVFFNDLSPIEKFGFVIQKWAKEMGFKSVEIVMDGVGGHYACEYYKSSIKVEIHGFKYKLSDEERQILMDKLGLQGGDTLEVVNDDEEIDENMEEENNKKNIILLDDDGEY